MQNRPRSASWRQCFFLTLAKPICNPGLNNTPQKPNRNHNHNRVVEEIRALEGDVAGHEERRLQREREMQEERAKYRADMQDSDATIATLKQDLQQGTAQNSTFCLQIQEMGAALQVSQEARDKLESDMTSNREGSSRERQESKAAMMALDARLRAARVCGGVVEKRAMQVAGAVAAELIQQMGTTGDVHNQMGEMGKEVELSHEHVRMAQEEVMKSRGDLKEKEMLLQKLSDEFDLLTEANATLEVSHEQDHERYASELQELHRELQEQRQALQEEVDLLLDAKTALEAQHEQETEKHAAELQFSGGQVAGLQTEVQASEAEAQGLRAALCDEKEARVAEAKQMEEERARHRIEVQELEGIQDQMMMDFENKEATWRESHCSAVNELEALVALETTNREAEQAGAAEATAERERDFGSELAARREEIQELEVEAELRHTAHTDQLRLCRDEIARLSEACAKVEKQLETERARHRIELSEEAGTQTQIIQDLEAKEAEVVSLQGQIPAYQSKVSSLIEALGVEQEARARVEGALSTEVCVGQGARVLLPLLQAGAMEAMRVVADACKDADTERRKERECALATEERLSGLLTAEYEGRQTDQEEAQEAQARLGAEVEALHNEQRRLKA